MSGDSMTDSDHEMIIESIASPSDKPGHLAS